MTEDTPVEPDTMEFNPIKISENLALDYNNNPDKFIRILDPCVPEDYILIAMSEIPLLIVALNGVIEQQSKHINQGN